MENNTYKIKYLIYSRKEDEFLELLRSGLDPNFEGGWPIRLAARYGCSTIVETLIQFGANPHLLSESGASTLQLAVFSGERWSTDKWTFLLSCCDSSQLADGAAVAIIFNNDEALKKILATGRCNTNIPTTLTGKTLELLAKGYKLTHLLNTPTLQSYYEPSTIISPRVSRQNRTMKHNLNADILVTSHTATDRKRSADSLDSAAQTTYHPQRNLSPSVARFFHQTAGQTALSPTRRVVSTSSLTIDNNN